MSKHTPGPWLAEFGEAYRVRAQQDGGQVAIMMNMKGQFGLGERRTGKEVAANARLIAASPDLLEAAKFVLAWYEAEDDHSKEPDFWKRVAMSRNSEAALRAAIAKAEGVNHDA